MAFPAKPREKGPKNPADGEVSGYLAWEGELQGGGSNGPRGSFPGEIPFGWQGEGGSDKNATGNVAFVRVNGSSVWVIEEFNLDI